MLEREYTEESVRGIEDFEYLWIVWEFSANKDNNGQTVRPPRLGGNRRVGVFASRSPFRPNRLGLSCVRLERIDKRNDQIAIVVRGADLMDGTPIYDIKPYVAYSDAHSGARCGFVDAKEWKKLQVIVPDVLIHAFAPEQRSALIATLEQDPRPQYHSDANRIYGMIFGDMDVRFRVEDKTLYVVGVTPV